MKIIQNRLKEYIDTKKKTGIGAITLKEGDELFAVKKTNGNEDVIIAANKPEPTSLVEMIDKYVKFILILS